MSNHPKTPIICWIQPPVSPRMFATKDTPEPLGFGPTGSRSRACATTIHPTAKAPAGTSGTRVHRTQRARASARTPCQPAKKARRSRMQTTQSGDNAREQEGDGGDRGHGHQPRGRPLRPFQREHQPGTPQTCGRRDLQPARVDDAAEEVRHRCQRHEQADQEEPGPDQAAMDRAARARNTALRSALTSRMA